MEFKKAWDCFCILKERVSRLFHHHNKKVVLYKQNDGRNEHTDHLALYEFQRNLYLDLKKKILGAMLQVLARVRNHQDRPANLILLASVFRLIEAFLEPNSPERRDLYEKVKEMLHRSSEEYYRQKLTEWNTDDCGAYFEWLNELSLEEEDNQNQISTNSPEMVQIIAGMRTIFYQILVESYKMTLVKSQFGLAHLLTSKNYPVIFL